ncbi:MAG: hypothetical protein RLZZ428_852 [Pseudomonadota bacterium]
MSIQDNVNYVKSELSGDEKVLESAFRLEAIYKKYKLYLWAVVGAGLLFLGGSAVVNVMHEAKLAKANQAFLTLQKQSDDAVSLKILAENNPALYELYTYAQAIRKQDTKILATLSKSTNSVIADASSYALGALNQKPVDSTLYKELSFFEEAYLALNAGDVKKAQNQLERISDRSPLAVVAQFLKHSTLKGQ